MKKILSVFLLGLLLVGCSSNKTETTTIKGDLLTNILDEKNLKNGATNNDYVNGLNNDSDIKLTGNFEDNSNSDDKCLFHENNLYYLGNGYFYLPPQSVAGGILYKSVDGKCQVVGKNSDDSSKDSFSSLGFASINDKSYVGSYEAVERDGMDIYELFRVYELDGLTPKLVYDFGNVYEFIKNNNFSHFAQYQDTLFLVGALDKVQYVDVKTKKAGTITIDPKILKDNKIDDFYVFNDKVYLTTSTNDDTAEYLPEMYEFDIKDVLEKELATNPTYTYKSDEIGKVFDNYIFKNAGRDLTTYTSICINKDNANCLTIKGNDKYDIAATSFDFGDNKYLNVTLVNKETKVYSYYIYNIEDKSTYKLYDRQSNVNTYSVDTFIDAKGQFAIPNIIEDEFYAKKYNKATPLEIYLAGTEETPAYLKLKLK